MFLSLSRWFGRLIPVADDGSWGKTCGRFARAFKVHHGKHRLGWYGIVFSFWYVLGKETRWVSVLLEYVPRTQAKSR